MFTKTDKIVNKFFKESDNFINKLKEDREAMHEEVEDYLLMECGEPQDSVLLHEEIDHPEKRSSTYEDFMEYYENK